MNEVLILGNGISRLLHEDIIEQWTGEMWATNYSYLEWSHKITRLTGHPDVLEKGAVYRDEGQYSFDIWAGNLGAFLKGADTKAFTCPMHFRKDSGSTLIAQALEERFDKIKLCGFDHGGRDIYTLDLHTFNKSNWVGRMRQMRTHYADGFDAIEYVGHDHMPYILSGVDKQAYYKRYVQGRPHIPDAAYIALCQLLYGSDAIYELRRFRMVKVRYITGQRPGWETEYRESIAEILEGRGEIEILGVAKEERPEEPEVAANMNITKRMTKPTLIKIALLRKLDAELAMDAWQFEAMTAKELRELLDQYPGDQG